ncbi:MAG TPA: methyltransferase domain-containing protein [Casimicrobiaceae bacterium]|nr:methyltransferase domain-containing protein [Casimicrobiaceae bacterium]
MNPNDLPLVGAVSNADKDFFGRFTSLRGKKVLCIGFSPSEIDDLVAKYGPSAIVALTNWTDHHDAAVRKYPLVIGDITKRTPFADDAFDAVLTLSVLEHLHDLGAAFDEMTRIVKNEGEMIHMFGPAWSSAYGHHIYENASDELLNFSLWTMPAHIHLLCGRKEIVDYYLERGHTPHLAHGAVWWFYEAPHINRVFYDDYLAIFEQDRFELARMEIMYNLLPRDHVERLRAAYPGRRNFSAYGGKYRLVVRK